MIHTPKILDIKISYEKGQQRHSVNEGVLELNHGLVGDSYAKAGEREVCLMSKKTKDKLPNFDQGLCVKRFVETILIDLDPGLIQIGDQLILGDASVEITGKGKRCFSECELIQNKETCPLVSEPLFGKVLKSGKIKTSL